MNCSKKLPPSLGGGDQQNVIRGTLAGLIVASNNPAGKSLCDEAVKIGLAPMREAVAAYE